LAREGARITGYVHQLSWRGLGSQEKSEVWTDDYSNLLGVFRWSS
jgi:hypothetical protein